MKALIEAMYLGYEEGSFTNRETGRPDPYTRASFLQDLDTHKFYIRDDASFDIRQFEKGQTVVLTVEITVRADKTYQSLVDVEEGSLVIQPPLVGKEVEATSPVNTPEEDSSKTSAKTAQKSGK